MTIKVDEFVDLVNFDHVRFSFTLQKSDLELDPNNIKGVMLQEQGENEEYYLVGLLHYLALCYGHHLGTALLAPLIASMAEEERGFGAAGINDEMAQELRSELEAAVLDHYSQTARAA